MTISKDDSIITQVAAKIAGDIAVSRVAGSSLEDMLSDYSIAFNYVRESLFDAHGASAIASVEAAMPGTTVMAEADVPRTEAVSSAVRVRGEQHGDLPDWLIKAAKAAGVAEVWDNRDKAAGTKQPWFRQVVPKGEEAKAFWPPKAA